MLHLIIVLLSLAPFAFGQLNDVIGEAVKNVDLANNYIQEALSNVEALVKSGQDITLTYISYENDVGGVKNPIADITYGIPSGLECPDASTRWTRDPSKFYPCLVAPNQLATKDGNLTTDCSNRIFPVAGALSDGDTSYYNCNNNKLVIQVCFKSGFNSVLDNKCILFVGVTRSSPLIDFQDPDDPTLPVELKSSMDRITMFRCVNPRGYLNDGVNSSRPFGFIERGSDSEKTMIPVIRGLKTSPYISLDLCFNSDI